MVNHRQVLKTSLEQRLQNNIEMAKKLLDNLNGSIQQVESNSATAKDEVHRTVDSIQQLLVSRKIELTRQIDLLCRTQINSLQEEIQDTYIALGSLQSTLSNLDSFDHNQLLNLNVHDLSMAPDLRTSTPLELNVDATILTNELEQWGSVAAKGLKGLIDVGTSASMPQRFVDYNDKKTEQELMSHKLQSTGTSSVFAFGAQPKLPCKTNLSVDASNIWEKVDVKDLINPEKSNVEHWLTKIEFKSSPEIENDDFELVSIETVSENENHMTNETALVHCDNESECKTIDDESSSIVCLENENSANNDQIDFSKWLKPKKIALKQQNDAVQPVVPDVRPISASVPSNFTNPMDNRFVDFPCLRLDNKYWIPSKKPKSSFNIETLRQREVFPPTYSLPTPFWLKKYR